VIPREVDAVTDVVDSSADVCIAGLSCLHGGTKSWALKCIAEEDCFGTAISVLGTIAKAITNKLIFAV